MVWQDFLLACAAYHEDDADGRGDRGRGAGQRRAAGAPPVAGAVERLQREPVGLVRLVVQAARRGPTSSDDRGWGLKYYYGVFPKVVNDLAPTTPYWPGSPSSGHCARRLREPLSQRQRVRQPPRLERLARPRPLPQLPRATGRASAASSASTGRRLGRRSSGRFPNGRAAVGFADDAPAQQERPRPADRRRAGQGDRPHGRRLHGPRRTSTPGCTCRR